MIELAPGKVILDKFRLERQLARGGMGSVWVAHHIQLDTTIAIKFMDPEYASQGTARLRFEREAKAAAQLRTPHVVQVFDHGVDADTPYIAMELLEGEDLGARLKRVRRLSLAQASVILDQLAKGLQKAHDGGILHRDLKPGNIFLAKTDDGGDLVKILDFGIAKSLAPVLQPGSEQTQTGQILGSPHYMSPEQAKGAKDIDARSDLWSVGVILYRAVTGDRPFLGDTFGELLLAICTSDLPPPSTKVPTLGPLVDAFFAKALARDPNERFRTAREMAAAFAALAGEVTGPSWPRPPQSSIGDPSTGDILAPGAPQQAQSGEGTRVLALAEGTLTNASGIMNARPSFRSRSPLAFWTIAAAICGLVGLVGLGLVALVKRPLAAPVTAAAETRSTTPAPPTGTPTTSPTPAAVVSAAAPAVTVAASPPDDGSAAPTVVPSGAAAKNNPAALVPRPAASGRVGRPRAESAPPKADATPPPQPPREKANLGY